MSLLTIVAAAQYLRMSTEHQQYSIANQTQAIQNYADGHGFSIVQTYSDAAKSGLVLKHRLGLRQLLNDVVNEKSSYKAILVYDVSRWGRFQDTDESAHYEFLCKSAGIPVHYCAETFINDDTLPNLIMKSLKRTMAGEYSRELSVKVLAGQKRLAQLGFKQGGVPGYGLRRMLVSASGEHKQQLAHGERKSITTDRVILVPGPDCEVQIVREIYRMFIFDRRPVYAIASDLNQRGVKCVGDSKWDYLAVYSVLTHPKYVGCHVFGRTSQKLCTASVRVPAAEWIRTPGAFEAIIDQGSYDQAKRILADRTINKSDQELLDSLRWLLATEGRLSLQLVKTSSHLPSPSTYRLRFGSLRHAYELIGYRRPGDFGPIDLRRRTQALRDDLIRQIVETHSKDVSVVRRGGRWRTRLRLRNGRIVSVLVSRAVRTWKTAIRWQIDPVLHERRSVTLLARLDGENKSFQDFYVLPNVDRRKRFLIELRDKWLERGEKLRRLSQFCRLAHEAKCRAVDGLTVQSATRSRF